MNSNFNLNNPMCANCRPDDAPTFCKGRTDAPEQKYCEPCREYRAENLRKLELGRAERERRQKALQECFNRNAEEIARACDEADRAKGGGGPDLVVQAMIIQSEKKVGGAVREEPKIVQATVVAVHDDCPICLETTPTGGSWTRLQCGHEMCVDCYKQCSVATHTSQPGEDAKFLGNGCREVICPLCRAVDDCSNVPELKKRIAQYRAKASLERVTITDLRKALQTVRDENYNLTSRSNKALADKDNEIVELKRQMALMRLPVEKAVVPRCDSCGGENTHPHAPFCSRCMTRDFGAGWDAQCVEVKPDQKQGGRALSQGEVDLLRRFEPFPGQIPHPDSEMARAVARGEPVVVIPRHQPPVMVGGGGGGAVPRRPCRNHGCETPKPTQRRCPNHPDTPCCKRCEACQVCRGNN